MLRLPSWIELRHDFRAPPLVLFVVPSGGGVVVDPAPAWSLASIASVLPKLPCVTLAACTGFPTPAGREG
jgi:hypothetical protein